MDERTNHEKLIDSVAELAKTVAEYFKALVYDYKFQREEALQLTLQFQQELFELIRKGQDKTNDQNS